MPGTRREYWQQKLHANVVRDQRNEQELPLLGWQVLTVWECELQNSELIAERCFRILKGAASGD